MNTKKSNRFSLEIRERAVRMVQEHRAEYPSLWACIESIAPKIGCVAQTLHEWVKQHEIDTGSVKSLFERINADRMIYKEVIAKNGIKLN
jgi:transposase-like protein